MYKIAIIGSRETPEDTMHEMLDVLQRGFKILRNKQHSIETRSGGCYKGPDQLQFMLARTEPGPHICYLPDERKLWLRKLHPNVGFFALFHKTSVIVGLWHRFTLILISYRK